MYTIKNFMDNDDVKVIDSLGAFSVIEYQKDLSVMPETAMTAFYCSEMNVRKKQVPNPKNTWCPNFSSRIAPMYTSVPSSIGYISTA